MPFKVEEESAGTGRRVETHEYPNRDKPYINTRLEQSARIIQRTPDEVLPALVLAATWFDNAARDADIIRRNAITHPGFVPVIPLKVPVQ
ncbi:TPA: hypothetical protein J5F45_003858 [Escherichia coli]|nr:hypothetical protein [Escherichia coli]